MDFSSPSGSKQVEKVNTDSNLNSSQSISLFENDFPTLSSQSDLFPLNSQAQSSQTRKRTVEELFGDIDDITDDIIFNDQPNVKKHKGDKHAEDLALIEHILELRKLSKEKHNLTTPKRDYSTSSTERDKRNLSYRVPKYPFIGVKRLDNERVYIRFHSEEFEKEETQRIINECNFKGVLGDSFKEVWNEARHLVSYSILYILFYFFI